MVKLDLKQKQQKLQEQLNEQRVWPGILILFFWWLTEQIEELGILWIVRTINKLNLIHIYSTLWQTIDTYTTSSREQIYHFERKKNILARCGDSWPYFQQLGTDSGGPELSPTWAID